MGLLERVSTLIRANINDVIDRAEDPEKMIKQVILDMENQYMQVKTQVAVSIADQHMLEKKQKENEDVGTDWMRKAERAVDKQQDDLARAALDRYQTAQRLAQSYREQVDDQKVIRCLQSHGQAGPAVSSVVDRELLRFESQSHEAHNFFFVFNK